jgi:hypothetical protein
VDLTSDVFCEMKVKHVAYVTPVAANGNELVHLSHFNVRINKIYNFVARCQESWFVRWLWHHS